MMIMIRFELKKILSKSVSKIILVILMIVLCVVSYFTIGYAGYVNEYLSNDVCDRKQ